MSGTGSTWEMPGPAWLFCPADRPERFAKAAAVAEEVFAKNPLHPGAVHYLIHSYDDPVHAPLGERRGAIRDRECAPSG